MIHRRVVDPLDLGAIRRAANAWDVLALVIISLAVAVVPVVMVIFGAEERR